MAKPPKNQGKPRPKSRPKSGPNAQAAKARRATARAARALLREARTCALATAMGKTAWPYASLVLVAASGDGRPILLISKLAQHTRNLGADNRVSLLFDGTADFADRLTGPRLTVMGRARPSTNPSHRARFLARHPAARRYAAFADFAIYCIDIQRGHFIGGFGKIFWLTAAELGAGARRKSASL